MVRRKKTDNKIPNEKGQTIKWPKRKRTDNKMAKRNIQTIK